MNRVHEQRCDDDPRPSDVGAEDDPRRLEPRKGVGRFNIAATDDVEAPFIGRNIVNPLALDTSHKEWSIMMTMFIPKSTPHKMDGRFRGCGMVTNVARQSITSVHSCFVRRLLI